MPSITGMLRSVIDDLEVVLGEAVERLAPVLRGRDREALALEDLRERPRHVELVLDEQDARGAGRRRAGRQIAAASLPSHPHGRSIRKLVPTFGVLRTRISPR